MFLKVYLSTISTKILSTKLIPFLLKTSFSHLLILSSSSLVSKISISKFFMLGPIVRNQTLSHAKKSENFFLLLGIFSLTYNLFHLHYIYKSSFLQPIRITSHHLYYLQLNPLSYFVYYKSFYFEFHTIQLSFTCIYYITFNHQTSILPSLPQ